MAKIAERKMMTKEKSHSMAGKKRSRRGRRVLAWFLAIAMILTTISLPGNGKQARAMDISKQSEDEKLDIVMEGEVPVLKKITYSFKGDIGPSEGNWYLYVWEKGDTSGTDGTPAIVKGEALETSDEFYKVETDLDGEEGTVYVFGICFKDSRWSDDPSPEGWPSLSDACDYRIISDRSVADNLTVTVDGKKVSVSAEEVMADPTEYVCYHEWEVTKTAEPDCVKYGFIEKTCNKCGTVRTLPGDTALGHNYVDGSCTRCRVEDPTPIKPSGEGTKESPYQITKVGELYWFAGLVNGDSAVCDYKADSNPEGVKQNLSACAELVNDITVNKGVLDEEGNPVAGQFTEWIPIGGESNKYAGTFNGNEKAIRGLYINNAEKEYVGLFGYNDTTARIENLSVTDSYFYAQWYVGGVCARNEGGTIQNCHNSSRISGGGYYNLLTAGGICAFNNGTITKCSNSGTIYGNVKVCWLGGICCGNRINGIVENCVNTGTIEVGNFCEDGYIGGVAGYNFEKIKGCHNEGTIEGGKNVFSNGLSVGGVSGGNKGSQSQIIRCYNTGSVNGNRSAYTGGVCGYCEYISEGSGIVQLCYNDGEVSGSGAGGLCGYNDRARVLNCYNLKQMTDSYTKGICSEVSSNGGTVENCFSIGSKGIGIDHTTEKTAFINSYYTVRYRNGRWRKNADTVSKWRGSLASAGRTDSRFGNR
ncbi:MAG: GLUG motif-containing protein [bacterium]|nr:GLUG motif-containing protein [bacterium]